MQEKSEEDIDKSAVATHSKFQESWGKQTVWTGLSDVVACHVGDSLSQRAVGGEKAAKDLRHLYV